MGMYKGRIMQTKNQTAIPAEFEMLLQEVGKKYDIGDSGRFIKQNEGDEKVVSFLNWVFPYAKSIKASDVHFSSRENGCQIRIRHENMQIANEWLFTRQAALIINNQIRAKCRLPIHDIDSCLDSSFWMLDSDGEAMIDIRVSIAPTTFGQNIVCRLGNQAADLPLSKIDMPEDVRSAYLQVLDSKQGMIIVSGPTGSGKSATLAASISHLNKETINIMTVEDPVENRIPGANQVSINPHRTFAKVLRSFLRQDPDIIMVGEIRDTETAAIATTAANTGHLLLSSVHANNAPATLLRLMDLNAEPYALAEALLCFFSQRLVRKLCSNCAKTVNLSEVQQDQLPTRFPNRTYYAINEKGCELCGHQGHKGRIPVFEMAFNTSEVRQAILSQDLDGVRAALFKQSVYRTLTEAALEMSAVAKVDFYDALSVTQETFLSDVGASYETV